MYSNLTPEERYRLWFDSLNGIYYQKYQKLLNFFGSMEALFIEVKSKRLRESRYISASFLSTLVDHASEAYIDDIIANLEKNNICAYTYVSDGYPDILKEIYDPPAVLYSRGVLRRKLELAIAIIGSRSGTAYGIKVARIFARQLANEGVCIVSGLAAGIDGEASRGALASSSDYPTIAVLGTNIMKIFPQENVGLAAQIMERGAVISEYAPQTATNRTTFPQRNRIISGLSHGLLVVEAGLRSGTNITVDCAHEQGKNVYSVPGRITDELSAGTNALIRHGVAKPVFGINDILEDFGRSATKNIEKATSQKSNAQKQALKHRIIVEKTTDTSAAQDFAALTPDEKTICEMLLESPKSFDELCNVSNFSISYLINILTELEFSGIIKQSHGRVYELVVSATVK